MKVEEQSYEFRTLTYLHTSRVLYVSLLSRVWVRYYHILKTVRTRKVAEYAMQGTYDMTLGLCPWVARRFKDVKRAGVESQKESKWKSSPLL